MTKIFKDGVGGLIVRGNKILLCHRRDYDLWNLPLGKIERKEDIFQALKREIKEETGLNVLPKELVGVYQNYNHENINLIFLVRVISGKFKTNKEADKLRYFDYKKLPHNLPPKHKERIIDYFENFRKRKKVIVKIQKSLTSREFLNLNKK